MGLHLFSLSVTLGRGGRSPPRGIVAIVAHHPPENGATAAYTLAADMDLLEGEEVIWQGHPSWRANITFYLKWGLLALLPAIVMGVWASTGNDAYLPYWQWLLISLALLVVVAIADTVQRAAVLYLITTQRVRIRRGILSRDIQAASVQRIQSLNTRQSLIDRMLGVGSVDFDTAGTAEDADDFHFRGVADPHGLVRQVSSYLADRPGAFTAPT